MVDRSDDHILMVRLDERTKSLERDVIGLRDENKGLKLELAELRKELKDNYIDTKQFSPIQRAIFTTISIIVGAVIMAVLNLLYAKGGGR